MEFLNHKKTQECLSIAILNIRSVYRQKKQEIDDPAHLMHQREATCRHQLRERLSSLHCRALLQFTPGFKQGEQTDDTFPF